MSDEPKDENSIPPASAGSEPEPRVMRKTPMFTARNAGRYSRQDQIRDIDRLQGTSLICYVGGDKTEIERDDTLGFADMLHNIGPSAPIDLMLHTCGGDVDACEKLIHLLQDNLNGARLRMIVPQMAKSAGTILALAADEILMSTSSELGMIDPQYWMKDSQGNQFLHSIVVYLRAFDHYSGLLSGNARHTLAERMLLDFDGKVVAKFRGIEERIRILAEQLLKRRDAVRYTAIVQELLSPSTWRTHGQPISAGDARDIGLPVKSIPMHDPVWQRYWALYCLQRENVGRDYKIFESAYVSQCVRGNQDEGAD